MVTLERIARKFKSILMRRLSFEKKHYSLYESRHGLFLRKRFDSIITGEKEKPKRDFIIKESKPGQVFVDIGACIGYYTIPLANKGLIVHSFEPEPNNAHMLKCNLFFNKGKATVHEIALSNRKGEFDFFVNKTCGQSHLGKMKKGDLRKFKVKTDMFDSYSKRAGIKKIDWVKIDVEGHEREVLEGMQKTLAKYKPIILIEGQNIISKSKDILVDSGYTEFIEQMPGRFMCK